MDLKKDVSWYAFKPIQDNPIKLDFSQCKYLGEIHQILKEKFGFPEYYGENWSALWDCLDGLFEDCGEIIVEVFGYYDMSEELQKGCLPMLEIFEDAQVSMPNVHFEYLS